MFVLRLRLSTKLMAEFPEQTEVFRKVFHAVPDDLVTTWKQYKEFVLHHERLNKPVSATALILNFPVLTYR